MLSESEISGTAESKMPLSEDELVNKTTNEVNNQMEKTEKINDSIFPSFAYQSDESKLEAESPSKDSTNSNSSNQIEENEKFNDELRSEGKQSDGKSENISSSSMRRRRVKTSRFEFDTLNNEDQRLLQQALKVSRKEKKRAEVDLEEAPIYHPTEEEFKNPMAYITKIRHVAEKYGICKIVPPTNWKPRCKIDMNNPKRFDTKLQEIHTLQEGKGFGDGRKYSIQSYKDMADNFKKKWCEENHGGIGHDEVSSVELAKNYWDIVETCSKSATVEYANDIDTSSYCSGFLKTPADTDPSAESKELKDFEDDYYAQSGWNLNNIPKVKNSVLKHIQTAINGVNVPWLYIGMLFSSFCWHNEDNYFYSINYSHFGDVKQWYGVPGDEATRFEKVAKDFLLELFREAPDLLHHMTTQVSPSLLAANGVPIYKLTQEPNTFIVTFPKAMHCGFSYGFNVGEAVNFASVDWITAGTEAEERYRMFNRTRLFSHVRLLFTLFHHKEELPQDYKKKLSIQVGSILDEEVNARKIIFEAGVRDLSNVVTMPPNSFDTIDSRCVDYDDMRSCCICGYINVFSCVACECDEHKVACTRHWNKLCKCSKEKKFMIVWAKSTALEVLRSEVKAIIDAP